MPYVQSALVEVRRIRGKGRGVFARARIPKGAVIERVPVILVPMREVDRDKPSTIMDHAYLWDKGRFAIGMGYASLYNHSYEPNAQVFMSRHTQTFVALRDIRRGEEITFNYNGRPRSRSRVDFRVI
jgi:SET domain-containing protein